MSSIVVANQNPANAQKIASVLRSGGLYVAGTCESGAQLMDFVNRHYRGGVIVTGVRLKDMYAVNLPRVIHRDYDFLFLVDPRVQGPLPDEYASLRIPLNRAELIATVDMFLRLAESGPVLLNAEPDEEQALIVSAKNLLMTRNHLSEPQAHRLIQKKSMDAGRRLAETAFLILNG